jgi:hypothetical protein
MPSVCEAGGAHSLAGSDNYTLCQSKDAGYPGNWFHCGKCGELFLTGAAGRCPKSGEHVAQGNECYLLPNYPTAFLVGGSGGGPEWLPGKTYKDALTGLNVAVDSFGGSGNDSTAAVTISWT